MLFLCILPNVDSYSKEMAAKNDTKALALSVSEHKQISSIVDYLQKGSLTRLDPKDYALLYQMLKWPLKMIFPGTCSFFCVVHDRRGRRICFKGTQLSAFRLFHI